MPMSSPKTQSVVVSTALEDSSEARPGKLSATVRPKTDLRAPFRFRTTGKLTLPNGVSESAGCKGKVTVRVKVGAKTISTRRVTLSKTCTYSSRVSFANRRRFGKAKKLRFFARFGGNTCVSPATAPTRTVHVKR